MRELEWQARTWVPQAKKSEVKLKHKSRRLENMLQPLAARLESPRESKFLGRSSAAERPRWWIQERQVKVEWPYEKKRECKKEAERIVKAEEGWEERGRSKSLSFASPNGAVQFS